MSIRRLPHFLDQSMKIKTLLDLLGRIKKHGIWVRSVRFSDVHSILQLASLWRSNVHAICLLQHVQRSLTVVASWIVIIQYVMKFMRYLSHGRHHLLSAWSSDWYRLLVRFYRTILSAIRQSVDMLCLLHVNTEFWLVGHATTSVTAQALRDPVFDWPVARSRAQI